MSLYTGCGAFLCVPCAGPWLWVAWFLAGTHVGGTHNHWLPASGCLDKDYGCRFNVSNFIIQLQDGVISTHTTLLLSWMVRILFVTAPSVLETDEHFFDGVMEDIDMTRGAKSLLRFQTHHSFREVTVIYSTWMKHASMHARPSSQPWLRCLLLREQWWNLNAWLTLFLEWWEVICLGRERGWCREYRGRAGAILCLCSTLCAHACRLFSCFMVTCRKSWN